MSFLSREKNSDGELIAQGEFRNALAFKGRSFRLYNEVLKEVRTFGDRPIYPPGIFPTVRNREMQSSLQIFPSGLDGELSQVEAAAVLIILNEAVALCNAFAISFEISDLAQKVLDLPEGGWQSDAMEAVSQFGNLIGLAAGVRERILSGEKSEGKTWSDRMRKDWDKKFANALKKDNLIIGKNTVEAIVKVSDELTEKSVREIKEGAKTNEELKARIESGKHGTRLAKELYLEVFERASTELSTEVGVKDVTRSPQKFLGAQTE